MGHGAARELSTGASEMKPLNPKLDERMKLILKKMDDFSSDFKERRDEERYGITIKHWAATCREIDAHLRLLAVVFHHDYQLSLDVGSDGGGSSMAPFLEETSNQFEKLSFRLIEGGGVKVVTGEKVLGKGTFEDATKYHWVERAVVEWVHAGVQEKISGEGQK